MNSDVIVVGGGPAGLAAALAAARNGAAVLLVEQSNCLGGMLTNGLVPMLRTAGDAGGLVRELWERLAAADGALISERTVQINPCVYRAVAFEMALAAGVHILLHTFAADAAMPDGHLRGVWLANKGGYALAECRLAIDASGDGDLAAWAGAPCDKGRAEDGALQAVSLNFILAGVAKEKLPPDAEFKRICADGLARGEIDLPPPNKTLSHGAGQQIGLPPGVIRYQYDMATQIDATNPHSLTRGEIVCHLRVLKIWRFLKKHFAAFENSVILDIASTLGVRETRRICGRQTLTEADVREGRKHPDGIAKCSWYMDLHDGQEKLPRREYRAQRAPPAGDYFEIPFGCLIPKSVDNLLAAGRCISSTRSANGALRLQPTCMNTGQAAGTAAAWCLQRDVAPSSLDGAELRLALKKQGMDL